MILLDANILIYAYDASSSYHQQARNWLEHAIATETVRLSWTTVLAFLRITTNPRAVERPLSHLDACELVSQWMAQPSVGVLAPGARHWSILRKLIEESGPRGPLMMDAHLAALAIEYGAVLCTHDRNFARFAGLRVEYPL